MGEVSNRDAVIAAIRRANAGQRADRAGQFTWDTADVSGRALVDLFVTRAQAAQASVSVVRDFAGATERVAQILASVGAQHVLVSGDALRAPWRLENHSGSDFGPIARGETENHSRSDFDLGTPVGQGFSPADHDAGITCAAYGMADTGTVVVCSDGGGGRLESLLPPVHIALLRAADILPGLPELLAALQRDRRLEQSSAVTLITGPSRTADIELTLTIGVHGPKQLFIVVVDVR